MTSGAAPAVVRIRFFAWLRDATGTDECWMTVPAGAQALDAKAFLVSRYQRLSGLIDHARLAVNQEYQPWAAALHDGDELSLIPPVSGG